MYDSKTVRSDDTDILSSDPIYTKQKKDVATMRTSLLACNGEDVMSTRAAIQNITAMRVYHQLSRIIRYTEMMDKLEAKLYEALDYSIDNMDASNASTWLTLLGIQEKLQKSMIESHKLLQPYLDMEALNVVVQPPAVSGEIPFAASIMDQDSRDRVRESAQAVLSTLQANSSSPGGHTNE